MDSGNDERGGIAVRDNMNVQALQRDASHAGNEIKLAHARASCVKQGAEVLALSADYAILQLFREQQHCWSITNLHERAGARMWAFCQGYQGEAQGRFDVTASLPLPDPPMRARRRRGMHRHRRQVGV
jgi:hypothetical protein